MLGESAKEQQFFLQQQKGILVSFLHGCPSLFHWSANRSDCLEIVAVPAGEMCGAS